MIDTRNGEFIFDKFTLHPHLASDNFIKSMQQENVLSTEMRNTPALGNVTDIYLKPQKSKDKYFVIRLFFSTKIGLYRLIISLRHNESVPSWDDWSVAQQMQIKCMNDAWLIQELGNPPYEYTWGTIKSVFNSKDASSHIVVDYY